MVHPTRRVKTLLTWLVLVTIFLVRFFYGYNIPLSGDEAGVGLLQATGNWSAYQEGLPVYEVTTLDQIRAYLTSNPGSTASEVIRTMRDDQLHPPLYFVMLHFVVDWFGNSASLLRGLSVFLSVLSVVAAYRLGKELYGERAGVVGAMMVALSPYCLEYSIMVRLYPLAMLLALLSSWLVIRLVRSGEFSPRNQVLYYYILVSVAGLYTYYSFGFLLVSHLVFIILVKRPGFRDLLIIIGVYLVIGLLLIPWILPMLQGVGSVQDKDYYFKGTYTLSELAHYFRSALFLPFRNGWGPEANIGVSIITWVVSICLPIVFAGGHFIAGKQRLAWSFLVSVCLYMLVFIVADRIFETRTMTFDRQHYYTVPILLLLTGAAIYYFPAGRHLRRVVFTFVCILLISGSYYRWKNPSVFDGPYYFREMEHYLQHHTYGSDDHETLLLYNMKDKRFVLPYAYMTARNYNLVIAPDGNPVAALAGAGPLGRYKNIFLINIEGTKKQAKRMKIRPINSDTIGGLLAERGFQPGSSPFVFRYVETLTIHSFHQ